MYKYSQLPNYGNDPDKAKKKDVRFNFNKWKQSLDCEEWRERQWIYQDGNCAWCKKSMGYNYWGIHIDHVKPLSAGGSNYQSNLVLAHSDCNVKKGSKTYKYPKWIKRNRVRWIRDLQYQRRYGVSYEEHLDQKQIIFELQERGIF